jgi:hypothetical protein
MNKGKQITIATQKFLGSDIGLACKLSAAEGQYLENRLVRAFRAGFDAGVEFSVQQVITNITKSINDD